MLFSWGAMGNASLGIWVWVAVEWKEKSIRAAFPLGQIRSDQIRSSHLQSIYGRFSNIRSAHSTKSLQRKSTILYTTSVPPLSTKTSFIYTQLNFANPTSTCPEPPTQQTVTALVAKSSCLARPVVATQEELNSASSATGQAPRGHHVHGVLATVEAPLL